MKTYTFVIGSIDDFDFIESLMDYVDQEGTSGHLNYSCHEFEAPEECDEDTVMMIRYTLDKHSSSICEIKHF